MLYDEEKILLELNAVGLTDEEQQDILDNVGVRLGEALQPTLSEGQWAEYKAIVDANQEVIAAWLAKYIPEYKKSELYEQLAVEYDDDPEKIQPEKVVASVGWVEKNIPNVDEIIAKVISDYREERIAAVESINLVQ